ncbi:MAG: protein phosphatase 2C domain-containing protein [Bdellovibrionota bacterium]
MSKSKPQSKRRTSRAASVAEMFRPSRGSVMGYRHFRTGTNNQDAEEARPIGNYFAAMLSDGISTHEDRKKMFSEFGARAIVNIGLRSLASVMEKHGGSAVKTVLNKMLRQTALEVIALVQRFAHTKEMAPREMSDFLEHHFGATMVGVIIGPRKTHIFWLGDGLYAVNEKVVRFGRDTMNHPANIVHVAWDLLVHGDTKIRFGVHSIDTSEIDTLFIGTDGMDSWFDTCKNGKIRKPVKNLLTLVKKCGGDGSSVLHGLNYNQLSRSQMETSLLFGDDATYFGVLRNRPKKPRTKT